MLIVRLLRESLIFAFQAIIVNKIRTILSLLGITIGIFCIISVFTIFDSMEIAIRTNIESLGSNVLFVQKWPWAMGGDYPWWKYYQRPETSLDDMREIQKRSTLTDVTAFMMGVSKTVKYQSNYVEGVTILGVSHEYDQVLPFEISDGRYFSSLESTTGKAVAIIGNNIAEGLYPGVETVGQKIKVMGRNVEVIGVINKEGEDMFSNSNDDNVILPINYFKTLVDIRDMDATIIVKARPYVSNDELRDELTGIMRSVRKLKPSAEDNFAINETSIITQGFDALFGTIGIVGWIIGGFSLLVGGFGIANIMFVSVRERTGIIGIQKALGAKNYFILFQFLFEAIFLSLIGGVVGLLIVFILTLIVSQAFSFDLILTAANIWLGIGVSAAIGLISGIIPAFTASRLDPVEAMRSTG
ncbi:MAG: FtsX-like permease family protein [Bacteroidetes bacterium]|nr:MAG: FtsX-like permease family protein [Bacteroidota bacterium]